MSYLKTFKHDVFLSYAHVDNVQKGWVTTFCETFKFRLNQKLGRTDSADIWFDPKLRSNDFFDKRIKESIEKSAIFIAFTSTGFYASDYCVNIELPTFYNAASNSSIGIAPDFSSRIFNIQLFNIHFNKWAPQFSGTSGIKMYKPHPLRPDDLGFTLEHDDDKREYDQVMDGIVSDVHNLIVHLKSIEDQIIENAHGDNSGTSPVEEKYEVFISKTTDTLMPLRRQIIKELKANNISVCDFSCPPPYEKDKHNEIVENKVENSKISLHLFDAFPGLLFSDDSPNTFNQEQALIAKKLNKDQLIFIAQDLRIEDIDDDVHREFLGHFINEKKIGDNHTLIRESSVSVIIDHIKSKLIVEKPIVIDGSVLLDFNEADFKYALEYYNSLMQSRQKIYMSVPGTNPYEGLNNYEQALKEVNTVIIMWITVAQEWVGERIKEIIRAIRTGKSQINKINIYKEGKLVELDLKTLQFSMI